MRIKFSDVLIGIIILALAGMIVAPFVALWQEDTVRYNQAQTILHMHNNNK